MFKTTAIDTLKQDKKCQACWYIILSTMSGSTTINSSKELLDDFNLAIKNRLLMLKRVNENYNVKITDLEEYRRNRPLIETLKANNLELEKAKKRIFDLEAELFKRQQEWSASNSEFELVNTELKPPIESAELYPVHHC